MPRQLLIRAGKEPWIPVSPESTLSFEVMATNSGNILFGTAVFAALSSERNQAWADYFQVERTPDTVALAAPFAERYDHLVLPFANAFRPGFLTGLQRWTDLIENLDLPVSVVGIGGQFSMDRQHPTAPPEVDEAASRFVRAVLERGPSIGVRGPITAAYLHSLGFGDDVVDVIGCPSLYRPDIPVQMTRGPEPLGTDARIALNLTPTLGGARVETLLAEFVERTLDTYDDVLYIPQVSKDLAFMLWGTPYNERSHPDLPWYGGHRLFTGNRARFFVDDRTWREHLSEYDFAVGNRIHGTIAAVLAGLPAVVLPFSPRISELAEVHALPQVPLSQVDSSTSCAGLYDLVDTERFNRTQAENVRRYGEFLDRHRLDHAFDRADDGQFAERMAAVELPNPVPVLPALTPEPVLERLRWLAERDAPVLPADLRDHVPDWSPVRADPAIVHEEAVLRVLRQPRRLLRALGRRILWRLKALLGRR